MVICMSASTVAHARVKEPWVKHGSKTFTSPLPTACIPPAYVLLGNKDSVLVLHVRTHICHRYVMSLQPATHPVAWLALAEVLACNVSLAKLLYSPDYCLHTVSMCTT